MVILDVRLPGMDGLSAIKRFQEICGTIPIIVITAYGDLQTAVEAVRRGAFDYIAKPFDAGKVKGALGPVLASRPGQSPTIATSDVRIEGMVGRSPVMQEVYKQIALAAASDVPVLLCGESGTGKELAASAIHRYSSRADGPFVAVNVSAPSPSVAESELFGHVRDAIDGVEACARRIYAAVWRHAVSRRGRRHPGADTSETAALEHGAVTPLGGSEAVRADFRYFGRHIATWNVAWRSARFDTICIFACRISKSICRRARPFAISASWPSTLRRCWPSRRVRPRCR